MSNAFMRLGAEVKPLDSPANPNNNLVVGAQPVSGVPGAIKLRSQFPGCRGVVRLRNLFPWETRVVDDPKNMLVAQRITHGHRR